MENTRRPQKKNVRKKSKQKTPKTSKTPKKRKGWLIVLIIAIVLVVGYFIFFRGGGDATDTMFRELTEVQDRKDPYVIMMVDDMTTISKDNEKMLSNIKKDYEKEIKIFYVTYNNTRKQEKEFIISTYDMDMLPSVVLCEADGTVVGSFTPPFDESELRLSIERLSTGVNDEEN